MAEKTFFKYRLSAGEIQRAKRIDLVATFKKPADGLLFGYYQQTFNGGDGKLTSLECHAPNCFRVTIEL